MQFLALQVSQAYVKVRKFCQ